MIPQFQVPQWPELAVANLTAAVLQDKQLVAYLPDQYHLSTRSPERDFFWGIIFGVKPAYGKALVASAIDQRNQPHAGQHADEIKTLVIQKDILDRMLAAPLLTCKFTACYTACRQATSWEITGHDQVSTSAACS